MRRLLREPVTSGLVLLCVGWTLVARMRDLTPIEAGALTGARLWEGEYWRLFSAMVVHHLGSSVHLAVNGLSLLFVGRVIERGFGWRVLLACVVGGALAGSAMSLLWHADPRIGLMGISGGIAGLLGLLLAGEWAVTRSFLEFARQRNTLLILFFIALSVPLAILAERWGMKVDHADHVGGFAYGLLFGLAYDTRRGIRTLRGAAVALALAILPVAYASHPLLDPGYRIWRAGRAYAREDFEAAAREFERARELDPGALDAPGMRDRFLECCLRLAAGRLGTPDAQRLVQKALALGGRRPMPWIRFAEAAEEGQHPDQAYLAWREAAALLPDSEAWRPLGRALRILRAREAPPVVETAEVARGAARGLRAGLSPEIATALEKEISDTADALGRRALEDPSAGEAARGLSDLYRTLAENAGEDARRPRYRLRSAEWLWRASGEAQGEVAARFGAAITEAALYRDPATAEAAATWFRERGMPVPEPDLEGEEGGG